MGKPDRANKNADSAPLGPSLKLFVEETDEPSATCARPLSADEALIRSLSDRLVEAQRPIRILDAIKWDDDVERAFFARGCRELPPVTREYYRSRPLLFDPADKREQLLGIERDIGLRLGTRNPAGQIMSRMCEEYRLVLDLLANRGTSAFAALSQSLYGSSRDRCGADNLSLADLGRSLAGMLAGRDDDTELTSATPVFNALQAVRLLSQRLTDYFQVPSAVRVRLSDGIVADAAAGSGYIKLRKDASFTLRDIYLLEVHEGWVHLGTTLNGQRQPVCTFLSKGPPSSTVTQEGLAVLTELLSFALYPARVRRLTHRIEGIAQAESGADFLEVYRFFCEQGYSPRDSYRNSTRIFRGSLPADSGAFTKDLCYGKGFLLLYDFMRRAITQGQARLLPLLFCGKTNLDDIHTLARLADEGLLEQPRYIPPPFTHLQALSAWFCFSQFVPSPPSQRPDDERSTLLE
jgi:uncharacterized protein (TIGR02421 family)